jgi:hypothetical protein
MDTGMLGVSRDQQVGSAHACPVYFQTYRKRTGHDHILNTPLDKLIKEFVTYSGNGQGIKGHLK